MPIPLANRLGQLNAPRADAGKAHDASQAYSNMGQMALNSVQLAQKATENMGAALQLVQRQKEDIIAKEAILQYEKDLSDAQTALEQHQGLAAEKYRNGKYREALQKAQNNFNASMSRVKFSDIRNNAVQNNRESIINSEAKADMYVYKENLAARNAMSKDMLEFYKRQAKVSIFNPDFVNIEKDMAANTVAEVENIAGLNGYTDETYIKLKKQEALDNFYSSVAEEISHAREDGFVLAKGYLGDKKKNSEITTAAYDKAMRDLETDELTYQVMKNPNKFIKNGTYDEDLAGAIAPDLNDRERFRIIHAARAASNNGGGLEMAQGLESVAKRYVDEANLSLEKAGIGNKQILAGLMQEGGEEAKAAYSENVKKNRETTSFADKMQEYISNVYMPAKTNIVVMRNGTNETIKLSLDPIERQKQLAAYEMDPANYTVVKNFTALGDQDFDAFEKEFRNKLAQWDVSGNLFKDGLQRNWANGVEYSFMDAAISFMHDTQGLGWMPVYDVVMYMAEHKGDIVVTDKNGVESRPLVTMNLFEKGKYDTSSASTKDAFQKLLTAAIQKKAGTGTRQALFTGINEVDDLDSYINWMKTYRSSTGVQSEVARRGGFINTLAAGYMGYRP